MFAAPVLESCNTLPNVTFPVKVEVPAIDSVPDPVVEIPDARLIGSLRATVGIALVPPITMFEFPAVTLLTMFGSVIALAPPAVLATEA